MRKQETITLPGRRCGKTAAVLRLRADLERDGYSILDVRPGGVVARKGLGLSGYMVPDFEDPRAASIDDVGDELARLAVEGRQI